MATVLLAEHEPEVAEMSARYLRRDGLQVRLVTAGEPAAAELAAGRDDAAVLDLAMPGLDLRRIRRALRGAASRTPAVFLAAGPRPRGLAGARGGAPRRWLSRPFSPRQLAALVREVLAAPGAAAAPPGAAAAGLRLDRGGRAVTVGGRRVPLTATEFAVLAALAGNAGRVTGRRQLLAAAGRGGAGDRAADVYVAQLRAKLGPAVVISTVRGAGYRFGRLSGGRWPGRGGRGATIGGQQCRADCEGTSEPRECARRDPARRPRRSRRTAATRPS
jgi:two-component system response regulator ResD